MAMHTLKSYSNPEYGRTNSGVKIAKFSLTLMRKKICRVKGSQP